MTTSAMDPVATGTSDGGALAQHRDLVENALFGVGVLTEDGTWCAANPVLLRILGCRTEAEALSLDPASYFADPEDLGRILRARDHGRLARGVTLRWRIAQGREATVRVSGRALGSGCGIECTKAGAGSGEAGGDAACRSPIQVLVEDITERRLLEEQLRQAQKMESIGALSGGIAHDFNNILTIVLSNADLIAEALPSDSFHLRADLEELQRAARRGADLVSKLLSFSRKQELRPELVELGTLVQEASEMIRRLLPAPVTFEVEMDRRARHVVHADATAIQQILLNLVTNARDAMPDGGVLRVRLERVEAQDPEADDRILLSVRDTGTGMDRETRERVFEPFFTTKESGRGTGLGLPMVQALVCQLGGTVELDSVPSRGTTVRVTLPAADRAEPEVVTVAEPAHHHPQASRVLVAEDDEVIRRSIKRVLERHDYTVVPTADGQEALEWLGSHAGEVDLVITDLVMPRLGGVELYRQTRASGDPTRFLFTSGYLDPSVRAEVDADPALTFLPKPWTVAELVASVRALTEPPAPSPSYRLAVPMG